MAIIFEKGLKEKLLSIIPGYGGYYSGEKRRDTDRLIREKAMLFLEHSKQAIDQLQALLLQMGQRNALPAAEKLRSSIDMTYNIIRTAASGYTGFLDNTGVVNNKTLEALANYDAMVVVKSKNFQKHCEELADRIMSSPDIAIKEILDLQREIEVIRKDFERRKDIMTGMENIEEDIEYV